MCLIKTHRLPKISRKPIQVYKVFKLIDDKLVTPYQLQICKVGEIIKSTKHSWFKGVFKSKIEGEGIHAYRNKGKAEEFVDSLYEFSHIYICEIPPFTPYWIGYYGDIAASKMVIKERVEL